MNQSKKNICFKRECLNYFLLLVTDLCTNIYMENVNKCRTVLVKNLIKESFYGKRKKVIKVLTAFFIFHKSDVKTFLK